MKLDILMHYEVDEITGEIKFIGKEDVKVDTASTTPKKSTSPKTIVGTEPVLVLDDNKYSINQLAADLLGVEPGDTIHINYPKRDKELCPAIGSSASLGVKAGNKLTKSLTVSYRGLSNEKLSEFGAIFKFEPTGKPGVFYLIGDRPKAPEDDSVIKIDEEFTFEQVNPDMVDNSDDLDLSDLNFEL